MSAPSPETNVDLQRLRRAKSMELVETLRRLIEREDDLDETAEILEGRIEAGTHVPTQQLAEILSKTKKTSLFELSREKLFQDQWALLILYCSEYPDPTIEETLTEILISKANNDGDPIRRDIVNAIRDHGTTATLPALEAVLYELAPTQHTKSAIASALFNSSGVSVEALLASLTSKATNSFLEAITQAIRAVRERNVDLHATQSKGQPPIDQLVTNAHVQLEKASRAVQEDPTYALVCLRRGAEAMGKHLYRQLGHENKGKPAKKMMLNELLKPISESDAPEVFKIYIQALQPFGNYAAHDQDDGFANLTPQVAEALIVLFKEALAIFEQWLRNMDRNLK